MKKIPKKTAAKAKISGGSKVTQRPIKYRGKKNKVLVENSNQNIIDADAFYKIINKLQLNREKVSFTVSESDSAVIENIMRDLSIPFQKKILEGLASYDLDPPPEIRVFTEVDNVEKLSDEIFEEGQIEF